MCLNKHGFTIMEFLVVLALVGIILTLSIPPFQLFFRRLEIEGAVRTAVVAMNSARYDAVKLNRRIKFTTQDRQLVLMKRDNGEWIPFKQFAIDDSVDINANASPVFSPLGTVSPLCSIYVTSEYGKYKISISMAGRIKVMKLKI